MQQPRILFVKLGAIGDVAMALNILPRIERAFPKAHLSWMCGKTVEPLLRVFPRINELIVVDDQKLFGRQRLVSIAELFCAIARTALSRYDFVLHGNTDWRYRFLTCAVVRREMRGWNRHRRRPWPIPGRYHGDEYARLIVGDGDGESVVWARPQIDPALLPTKSAVSKLGDFVVLCPGGAKNQLADDWRRRWPVENYVELAKRLSREGLRTVLVGAQSDAWTREYFYDVPHDNKIGETNLIDLLTVFRDASVVVTHDTANLHLAPLVGTPVVGIFGPTNPAERVPHNFVGRVLWGGADLSCRPCYDGRFYGDCRVNTCLQQVSVDSAFEAAVELLASEDK